MVTKIPLKQRIRDVGGETNFLVRCLCKISVAEILEAAEGIDPDFDVHMNRYRLEHNLKGELATIGGLCYDACMDRKYAASQAAVLGPIAALYDDPLR